MATRWRLTDGHRQWVIDANGSEMSLDATGNVLRVEHLGDGRFTVEGQTSGIVGAAAADAGQVWVTIGGNVFVFAMQQGAGRAAAATSDQDALGAPMPATVVRVAVQPGQVVRQGEILIALEAMKMELFIRAPRDGVVSRIHCQAGDLVSPGTMLVEMEMEAAQDGA